MENAEEPVTFIFTQYDVEFNMNYKKWKDLERCLIQVVLGFTEMV